MQNIPEMLSVIDTLLNEGITPYMVSVKME